VVGRDVGVRGAVNDQRRRRDPFQLEIVDRLESLDVVVGAGAASYLARWLIPRVRS
jgi:hypothetical protein